MKLKQGYLVILSFVVTLPCHTLAFLQPSSLRSQRIMVIPNPTSVLNDISVFDLTGTTSRGHTLQFYTHDSTPTTQLFMYNLPPDDDNNRNHALSGLLPSIVTIAGLALFFFSPLGGLFFALTNTLFVFALLSPFILFIGYQIWQYFYTIAGPCPNCGTPVLVLKDAENPTVCFNCGSPIISNSMKDGIVLYDDVDNIMDRQRSLWDTLFSTTDDEFSSTTSTYRSATTKSAGGDVKEIYKKAKREQTIIDIDVTEEK